MVSTATPRGISGDAPSSEPSFAMYLVVHGNWYAVQPDGHLTVGPVLINGAPSFEDAGESAPGAVAPDAESAIQEVHRSLRWLQAAGVERALLP